MAVTFEFYKGETVDRYAPYASEALRTKVASTLAGLVALAGRVIRSTQYSSSFTLDGETYIVIYRPVLRP